MRIEGLIGFMVGIVIFTFMVFSSAINDTVEMNNVTGISQVFESYGLFAEGSPFAFIFENKIMFFILLIIPAFMILKLLGFTNPFRGILYFIGDLFESNNSLNDDDDIEERKYLKEMKTKLKKDLKIPSKKVPVNVSDDKKTGSGVSWGDGVDRYGDTMKGGDKQNE